MWLKGLNLPAFPESPLTMNKFANIVVQSVFVPHGCDSGMYPVCMTHVLVRLYLSRNKSRRYRDRSAYFGKKEKFIPLFEIY